MTTTADREEKLAAILSKVRRDMDAKRAWERWVAAQVAWTPDFCPGVNCEGSYRITDPNHAPQTGHDFTVSCDRFGTQACIWAARKKAKARRDWYDRCQVPERYRSSEWDQVSVDAKPTLKAYCEGIVDRLADGVGILITGPAGTGKTMALVRIIAACYSINPKPRALFVSSSMLFDALHSTKSEDGVTPLDWYSTAAMLVIDDFGREYQADFGFARFEALVENRHANQRPTCISANLSPKQLSEREEWARIVDRWRETCIPLVMSGTSRRQPPTVLKPEAA